jgi:hypothetical protein
MSLNGINNPLLSALGPLARPSEGARVQPDRGGAQNGAATGIATGIANGTVARPTAPEARPALEPQAPIAGPGTPSTVPASAPAGTDPELWSVLTAEERQFFAKSAALGPLTYGRLKAATQPAPPAARGVRLDVRA